MIRLGMIDAHQHFWELGRHDCSWPTPDLAVIYRDCMPAELAVLTKPVGISGTVLVQSQESARDTDYLCDLAQGTDWVLAVVGWADLAAPTAAARIAELAGRPKLRGLRPMLQDRGDDSMLSETLQPGIRAMIAHGLRFDALIRPRHLPHLRVLAERRPELPIVIDHAAKPLIAEGQLDPWRDDLRALARLPNVFCKLSGLVTEAQSDWEPDDLVPYCSHVLECFGPERVMWGSDWPVLELRTSYSRWLDVAYELTAHLAAHESAAVFETTARRFYGLTEV
jgi:L-fuconolactonase